MRGGVVLDLKVKIDQASFAAEADRHLRFAASQAINATAMRIKKAEQANLPKVLDNPTPLTMTALGIQRSTKQTLTATIFMKDRTAWYLGPYETGGKNKLNPYSSEKGPLLEPVQQRVNQYGNLPRTTTRTLRAKRNVFSGMVNFGGTAIGGIWQRGPVKKRRVKRGRPRKGARRRTPVKRPLKLLIEYARAHPVYQRLHYRDLAQRVFAMNYAKEFEAALKQAMAKAKQRTP